MSTYTITLPYPPSANHRLGMRHGTFYKTTEYKRYEQQCHYIFLAAKLPHFPKGSKVAIRIDVAPPDKRIRDLDGILKVTLDQFQKESVVANDFDFWHLEVNRGEVTQGGTITCTLWLLNP